MSRDPNNTDPMTWPLLLAQWTQFARASAALPADGAGRRWRDATPAIIELQAIAHALADLDALAEPDDRPVALDRAAVVIRARASDLARCWKGEPMPASVVETLADVEHALAFASERGLEWRVTDAESPLIAEHPAPLVEALRSTGFAGELFVPQPGLPVFTPAPCAFLGEPDGRAPVEERVALVHAFLAASGAAAQPAEALGPAPQVYRRFDFLEGGPVADDVTFLRADPMPGQPLLVPALLAGAPQPVALPPRRTELHEALPIEDHRGVPDENPDAPSPKE